MPGGVTIPIKIQVFKGQTLARTETLSQDVIKIGKLSSSHLQLDDESVSRMHAVLEVSQSGEVSIVDLGSTKGTFVNGGRTSRSRVNSGDEVRIGDIRLIVTFSSASQGDSTQQVSAADIPRTTGPRPTTMGVTALSPPPTITAPPIPPGPPSAPGIPPVSSPGIAPQSSAMGVVAPPPFGAMSPASVPSPFGHHAAPAAPMQAAPAQVPAHIAEQVEIRDGSTAVEVSAMFEDAVVAVRHLDNPAGGQVSGATKGILGSGAAAMLGFVILFIISYVQVAHYREAKEKWEAAGKPSSEFITPREGAGRDVAAAFLLVYGFGALLFGLHRLLGERGENGFTIGPASGATLPTPGEGLPVPLFPLVRSSGTDYEVLFTHTMKGDLEAGGKTTPLQDVMSSGAARPSQAISGAYAMTLPQGARLNLRYGENTFNISSVARPRRYPVPLSINWGEQVYSGGVFVGVALFLLMIFSVPPDPKSLSLDAFMNDQRMAKFLIKPEEQKPDEIPDWLKKKQEENSGGKAAKEDAGKMGKKESKNKTGQFAIKGPPQNTDIKLAKEAARDAALKAGVLGIIGAKSGGIASIFGKDSALGNQADDVLGGLVGTQVGDAYGGNSMGLMGTGTGGGGTGEGTVGFGNLGTIGRGSGTPGGGSYGSKVGNLKNRKAVAPDVVPGTAEVRGSLDKELIRRIIRRHINEVKFCYEKELTRNQALQGRIMVQFTIGATGQVLTSIVQSSTMGNPPVEQCIAAAVRRWEFPKPQGGIVVVTYPFVLKASDG